MSGREVFERMLELLLAKDMEGVAELWAEDGTCEFPFAMAGAPARLEGREAVRDYLAGYPEVVDVTGFPSVSMHQTLDPDTVVAEFTAHGRTVSTGAPYELGYVAVVTVRDGRIASYRDYWSPVAVARASGDLPALLTTLGAESA